MVYPFITFNIMKNVTNLFKDKRNKKKKKKVKKKNKKKFLNI